MVVRCSRLDGHVRMNLTGQLREAIGRQRSGRYAEAERIYRSILAVDPRQPDALHLLGLAAHQQGRAEEAVQWIGWAIAVHPRAGAFHNNLGNALVSLGRLAEAIGAYEEALRLEPGNAGAHLNLGNAHFQAGRIPPALKCFQEAARLDPNSAEAHNNLGNALARAGRNAEALDRIDLALRLRPAYAEAHVNRSLVLSALGRADAAQAACRAALALRPEFAEAHAALGSVRLVQGLARPAEAAIREALRLRPGYTEASINLSRALADQRRWPEAEAAARQALARSPASAPALNNLGLALHSQGRTVEAAQAFSTAVEVFPEGWEAHYNLGNLMRDRRAVEEALASYGRAVEANPEAALPHWNRSLTLLWKGDYERGLEEYEWRWKRPGIKPRAWACPEWDGRPLGGRTILLHAEQGLGDTIQFLRYAALARDRGGRVLLECQPPVAELARGVDGVSRVVAAGEALPPFDVQLPLLSLPRVFETHADALPWPGPYIRVGTNAPPSHGRIRVGLSWAGNPEHPNDAQRSCGFEPLRPLVEDRELRDRGVEFHSLQKGQAPEGLFYSSEIESIGGVARIIAGLDLVIAVDSFLAHLAGAMGRTVWLLLAEVCDWRWGMEGDTTGWYPSMRLYRQPCAGAWTELVKVLKNAFSNETAKIFRPAPDE
jgi:tetratricopeptide (TPR) repeat protein